MNDGRRRRGPRRRDRRVRRDDDEEARLSAEAGWDEDAKRQVLLIIHTGRAEAVEAARTVAGRLGAAGVGVRVLAGETGHADLPPEVRVERDHAAAVQDCELIVVLGGDGTLLRAAELAREADIPLLGVNLGRVGFLAEAELKDLNEAVDRIVDQRYEVEERMTLDVCVLVDGSRGAAHWALNEASVEKRCRERMLEVLIEVDGRPLSRWGCDGVVCATPTGSTAYAFSGGGPVVWPEVEALLLVPISAHALFARPLVAAPTSLLAIACRPVHAHPDAGGPRGRARGATAGDRGPAPRRPGRGAPRRPPGPAGPPARRAFHRPPGGQVRPPGRRLAGALEQAPALAAGLRPRNTAMTDVTVTLHLCWSRCAFAASA